MIFRHKLQEVLDGSKTQTRRLLSSKHHYDIGKTYAVQPGRGKKAVARIRITDIRIENVRNISDEDVKAEEFEEQYLFWLTWAQMYDPAFLKTPVTLILTGDQPSIKAVNSCVAHHLKERPTERYDAWVLTFELVRQP